MEISLAAEKLFQIGSFPVTNSLLTTFLVMIFLIVVSILVKRKIKDIPSGFINFIELVIEGLFNLFDSVTQDRRLTRKFFPIVATIFLFVLVSNWTEILPGVASVGLKHSETKIEKEEHSGFFKKALAKINESNLTEEQTHKTDNNQDETEGAPEKNQTEEKHKESIIIPFLRAPSADLNFTLALAIISVIATQIFGILGIGFFKYIAKFINFRGPINFFVGFLELISEFAKLISFSLRLFGNIFAGEVLLMVIAFLIPVLAPLPFYFLELFVGLIQALVFAMLTLVFMTMAVKITEH
jgi:F-type H+-transporting ATPase subunit a